jgi:probable addiction module antidote protein
MEMAGRDGVMEMTATTRFDAAEYLDTVERQAAYITAAFETGDPAFVRDALGIVARARGVAGIAKSAELNRESLYKALGEAGNPEFSTVLRILQAMGLKVSVRPAGAKRPPKKRRAA